MQRIVQEDEADGVVFAKISDKNELAKFEADLMLTERFSFIKTWLLKQLKSIGCIPRMHEALYIIFNRVFLMECSWSGLGVGRKKTKVEIRTNVNILRLLKEIGNIQGIAELEKFFSKKLRNAGSAAQRTGVIKSVSRGKFTKKKKEEKKLKLCKYCK